jgi:hypothetical protein
VSFLDPSTALPASPFELRGTRGIAATFLDPRLHGDDRDYAVNFFRPLVRRRDRIFRPEFEELRALNPCFFALLLLFGWKVPFFMIHNANYEFCRITNYKY